MCKVGIGGRLTLYVSTEAASCLLLSFRLLLLTKQGKWANCGKAHPKALYRLTCFGNESSHS